MDDDDDDSIGLKVRGPPPPSGMGMGEGGRALRHGVFAWLRGTSCGARPDGISSFSGVAEHITQTTALWAWTRMLSGVLYAWSE